MEIQVGMRGDKAFKFALLSPKEEIPFPSQPFLKRNFDLLSPEAGVFISSIASLCISLLHHAFSGSQHPQPCLPAGSAVHTAPSSSVL